jgi:hypothetical protein
MARQASRAVLVAVDAADDLWEAKPRVRACEMPPSNPSGPPTAIDVRSFA